MYQPRRVHRSPLCVPTTRNSNAVLVPVCMALAGQTIIEVLRNVRVSSMTAQVSTVTRIWAIDTWKPSLAMPMTRIVMMTDDRWIRGSRMLGGTSGYERLPTRSCR